MIKEMLDLAAKQGIKSWTESFPMDQVGQKLKDMDAGKGAWFSWRVSERHGLTCPPSARQPDTASSWSTETCIAERSNIHIALAPPLLRRLLARERGVTSFRCFSLALQGGHGTGVGAQPSAP